MKNETKRRIVLGTLTSVLVLLSFVFIKNFSLSIDHVLKYPLIFFKDFISISKGATAAEAIKSSVTKPLIFLIPFIPITIAYSVLVFYGVNFGEDRKLCFISFLIPSIIGILLVGPSVYSLFFSIGLILSGTMVTSITVMYLSELKKWKKYRIGSKTISKCFFILNIILFLTLFVNTYYEVDNYTNVYRNETKNFVFLMVPTQFGNATGEELPEEFDMLNEEQREMIVEQYANATEVQKKTIEDGVDKVLDSPNMSSLINFSIFMIPFVIFSILELLRVVLFSPLAGFITRIIFVEVKL